MFPETTFFKLQISDSFTLKFPAYICESESCSVVSNSLAPQGLYPMEFSRPEYWSGLLSLLQGIFPTQGSNPGLPHCRRNSLPAEPQGKLKNTEVGSLSLLLRIFPTHESNWGLLHCRQILYQLSCEGSPLSVCLELFIIQVVLSWLKHSHDLQII